MVYAGLVQVFLRLPAGDMAVVSEMAPAASDPGCPLTARGCTRIKWMQRAGSADCAVRLVPLASIRRFVHIVPDFGDLGARWGYDAMRATAGDPRDARLSMRYFLNVFYPWDQ